MKFKRHYLEQENILKIRSKKKMKKYFEQVLEESTLILIIVMEFLFAE